jgi:hypothetical protein
VKVIDLGEALLFLWSFLFLLSLCFCLWLFCWGLGFDWRRYTLLIVRLFNLLAGCRRNCYSHSVCSDGWRLYFLLDEVQCIVSIFQKIFFLNLLRKCFKSKVKFGSKSQLTLIFQFTLPNGFTTDVEFLHSGSRCINSDIRVVADVLSKLLKQNTFEILNRFGNFNRNLDLFSTVLDQRFDIQSDLFHQNWLWTVNHCIGFLQFERENN